MKKKKIHKITETDNKFLILGIVSSANSYKLIWTINNILKSNLILQENYTVINRNIIKSYVFYLSSQENMKILANKCDTGVLVSKYKKSDYFLKLDTSPKDTENVLTILKTLKIIQIIFTVDLDIVTKKQKLMFANL